MAIGAVVEFVPGAVEIPGSRPAGLMAEVGLRWCGARPRQPMEISMRKPTKKFAKTSASKHAAKSRSQRVIAASSSHAAIAKSDPVARIGVESKQARVIAMLRSASGVTIAEIMQATGWQEHSVRGFLAGVVRRKLKLKPVSKKVDGKRIYRIDGEGPPKSNRPQSKRRAA